MNDWPHPYLGKREEDQEGSGLQTRVGNLGQVLDQNPRALNSTNT